MKTIEITEETLIPLFASYMLDNEFNRKLLVDDFKEGNLAIDIHPMIDYTKDICLPNGYYYTKTESNPCILVCVDNKFRNRSRILNDYKVQYFKQTVAFNKRINEIFIDWNGIKCWDFPYGVVEEAYNKFVIQRNNEFVTLYEFLQEVDMCWDEFLACTLCEGFFVKEIKAEEVVNFRIDKVDKIGIQSSVEYFYHDED
jgi:hypothetical protein